MSVGTQLPASLVLPSSASCSWCRRALPSLDCRAHLTRPPSLANDAVLGVGLKKPPFDDMSNAYHPAIPAYDGRAFNCCPSTTVPHAGRSKAMVDDTRSAQHRRFQASQTAQTRSGSHLASQLLHIADTTHRRPVTRPSTPPSHAVSLAAHQDKEPSRHDSETLIYHSLQIPRCISADGGSLSDFAAQMTCFFWFDSADNLKRAEAIRSKPPNAPIPRLPHLAKPFEQFRKWVYNVLSTTQVTQNVIFLALLFIYRLKMSTPQIKGRAGSEYRLLTVALMLGNKFLDDNTYTNKTWAEVSSFAVQEIHVMEVEFLSNMRYNLLTSKSEWEGWLIKLACFHDFYERALQQPTSPIRHPSKNLFSSPVPSPTATTLPTTSDIASYTPSGPSAAYSPSPASTKAFAAYPANATSPLTSKHYTSHGATRKRTPEEDLAEHPAKRRVLARSAHATPAAGLNPRPNYTTDAARLPVPQLTINTNQGRSLAGAFPAGNGYPPQVTGPGQHAISLPPLQAGIRAMSNVFPPGPSTTMAPQATVTAPTGPPVPTTPFSMAPLAGHPSMPYGSTPTKRQSPGSLASFGSSPMMEHLGPGTTGVHTPISHTPISNSPSVFLQQRASPYKPIRHVNTLLYPPPSASLDQYHLPVPVQPNQMHYQPLGRRHDVRTGVVPDFVVYNRGQQFLGSRGGQQGHYPS